MPLTNRFVGVMVLIIIMYFSFNIFMVCALSDSPNLEMTIGIINAFIFTFSLIIMSGIQSQYLDEEKEKKKCHTKKE